LLGQLCHHFLSHPSTRHWITYVYKVTLPECNIITLRFTEWDQNTFKIFAAVNLDLFGNTENMFLNKYIKNYENFTFISNQNSHFMRQEKEWFWTFQVVQNICWSVYKLLLEFTALYEVRIPQCLKHEQFILTCTWTGTAPWNWKQYLCPKRLNTHAETQKELTTKKMFGPEILSKFWRAIFKKLIKLC
jgi:hypothetical protein